MRSIFIVESWSFFCTIETSFMYAPMDQFSWSDILSPYLLTNETSSSSLHSYSTYQILVYQDFVKLFHWHRKNSVKSYFYVTSSFIFSTDFCRMPADHNRKWSTFIQTSNFAWVSGNDGPVDPIFILTLIFLAINRSLEMHVLEAMTARRPSHCLSMDKRHNEDSVWNSFKLDTCKDNSNNCISTRSMSFIF